MHKTLKYTVVAVVALIFISSIALGQNPPHPNGGGAPGGGNLPVGGGAPLAGGLIWLFSMAFSYATGKYLWFKNKIKN